VGGGSVSAGGGTASTGGGTNANTGGGSAATGGGTQASYPPLTADEQKLLSDRPYRLVVPTAYDGSTAVPFVLLLHGYSDNGASLDSYFGMSPLAQSKNFILATPNGVTDNLGLRYWNATDYCCGTVFGTKPDDVAYLTAIMDDVRLKYRIDEKRVFVVGHSNGGFMSHRMACDRADRVAAIVSFAGAQWKDISKCQPSGDVAILEAHGDNDAIVSYSGTIQYPGAVETTTDWSTLDGCGSATSSAGADLDLLADVSGAETTRVQYGSCPVELWTMHGGSHIPSFNSTWAETLYGFLMAHPKP
jgi:polyhydroxybutyrate depolymerase